MFPKARRSLHLLPFPASSPTGVGAFVEPKIITRRHVDSWVKEDKNTLEAYWDSYARAADNHPSIKSKMSKIGNKFKDILIHYLRQLFYNLHNIPFKWRLIG